MGKPKEEESISTCSCGHCGGEKHGHIHDQISCGCGCCDSGDKSGGVAFSNLFRILQIVLSLVLVILSVFIESKILALIFRVVSAIICGVELIISVVKKFLKKQIFSENLLMLIASITAFIIGEGVEGALIVTLFRLGEFLEDVATDFSIKKIDTILKIETKAVHVFSEKGLSDVDSKLVAVGSLIQVNKGERVPIDGVMIYGDGEFDTKAITGESKYLNAGIGEEVYSGSINIGDTVIIKTTKLFSDSVSQRIVKIVEESLDKKAKCQRFITSFACKYTPIVCVIALLIATVIPLFDQMNFSKWIYKALAFLVVSCPCALVISVPLAFFTGIGALAKIGVLVKSSVSIEKLSKANVAVFDKTGTLTTGEFEINEIKIYNGYDRNKVVNYAASIEKYSNHPIAKVISSISDEKVLVEDVKEITGLGVVADINDNKIAVGNARLMEKVGINIVDNWEMLTVYISINGNLAGKIYLTDKIKDNAKSAISLIKNAGVKKTIILSGDKKESVDEVGEILGIDNVFSELLPEEKLSRLIEEKTKNKGKIIYVGDGINDSPALANADVGVSMGGLGSDIAIESSDVVVMDDNLNKISYAINHSKKIMKRVIENIVFSLGVKFLVVVLSVAFTIPMGLAMFADVGVMCLAILNSMRCYKIKIRP